MAEVRSILMLSNGHGEDIIGAAIVEDLLNKRDSLWIKVMPIVGAGSAYEKLPVKIVGPRQNLPTGGFMRQNIKNFVKDVKGGLFSLTFKQINVLRELKKDTDIVICVGDVLLVILAGFFVKKPMIFIPTAKSEYISGHYKIEKLLMRKYADLILPRDEKTALSLKKSNLNAQFVGNAMMDCIKVQDIDFAVSEGAKVIGILPGSRNEAYGNMQTILKVIEELERLKVEDMEYITALASQLSLDDLERAVNECGWFMKKDDQLKARGVCAFLTNNSGIVVKLSKSYFADVLEKSDIVIGLAGTANEQAVGMGKPVVAFPTTGAQFNKKFVKAQKKLLGDSIAVVESDPLIIAKELLIILHDRQKYSQMSEIGRKRMGPRGGIEQMSKMILDFLFEEGQD